MRADLQGLRRLVELVAQNAQLILLGAGIPLCPPGTAKASLGLRRADRSFPDGTVEMVYAPR